MPLGSNQIYVLVKEGATPRSHLFWNGIQDWDFDVTKSFWTRDRKALLAEQQRSADLGFPGIPVLITFITQYIATGPRSGRWQLTYQGLKISLDALFLSSGPPLEEEVCHGQIEKDPQPADEVLVDRWSQDPSQN